MRDCSGYIENKRGFTRCRDRAEGEGKIGTMEKLVALTIVVVIVAFAMVYTVTALKGKSKGK